MENEENRGLINKKPYEDQLVPFCQFSFGALCLFSLSHSWTLREFLEHSNIGSRKVKEGPRRQRSRKEEQHLVAIVGLIASIDLHVCFLARFGMHGVRVL